MSAHPHLKFSTAILGCAVIVGLFGVQPASADVTWSLGNQQYTNVNLVADVNANTIIGDIGNTGITATFSNMIGPNGTTQVEMHAQHGVAFIESYADSLVGATHTGFSSLTITPETGYAFTAGDFALDQLNSLTSPTGKVTFTTISGGTYTLNISQNGQNQYNFITSNGQLITSILIQVATTDLLQDFKQFSVDVTAVPLPGALPLFLTGLGLMGLLSRRRKAKVVSPLAY